MKYPFLALRGGVILSVLALLPKLEATVLSVTQAISLQALSHKNGGNLTVYSSLWNYLPFDPSLGTLESVTFSMTATARVSAYDANVVGPAITPVPITVTPYVSLGLSATLNDLASIPTDFVRSEGPTVYVPPYGAFSHTAELTVGVTQTTSDAFDLARFSGLGLGLQGLPAHTAILRIEGGGFAHYGSNTLDGVVDAKLVYNYRVSERGQTVLLFGGCLATLVLVNRRRTLIREPSPISSPSICS